MIRSTPGDLLIEGLDASTWRVSRFDSTMRSVIVSHHSTEAAADAAAEALAKAERLNIFKPSGDGHSLAPSKQFREQVGWEAGPGTLSVKIERD
jgi:hypothetical protein